MSPLITPSTSGVDPLSVTSEETFAGLFGRPAGVNTYTSNVDVVLSGGVTPAEMGGTVDYVIVDSNGGSVSGLLDVIAPMCIL